VLKKISCLLICLILGACASSEKPVLQGGISADGIDFNQVFVKIRKGATKDFITGLEELAALRKSAVLSDFCVTVIQNMRKGSGELSGLFTTQAQLYRNERRRLAGKLADEAATLLLIPSTLVLIALIVMLLAPALMEIFNGFQ